MEKCSANNYPLKTVNNRCMHVGNHAIKVIYGQCNMKSWV